MNYFYGLFLAVDQLAHALIGGWPDETLSAAAFRWDIQGKREWPHRWINRLFWWQKDHCYSAWKNEFERRQLPDFYR